MSISNSKNQDNKMWNWGILYKPLGAPSLLRRGSDGSPKATQVGMAEQELEPRSQLPALCLPPFMSVVRFFFKNHWCFHLPSWPVIMKF